MSDDATGFEIAVRPSKAVRALRAAVVGLGVVGFALAAWLSRGREDGWILLALGAMMLWAGWRHAGFGLSWGTLRVSADGRAAWRPEGGGFEPVGIERWFSGEGLVWLRMRGAGGERRDALVGRAGLPDDDWRRLCAWLVWMRRGRSAG